MITPLNLPKADLKLKRIDGDVYVWSLLRKKNLLLTPEEWVRQHVVHDLINFKEIAEGRIAEEFTLEYNGRTKRADLVLFDSNGNPEMIVECKAPEVALTEDVLFQIAQYNKTLNVQYLMMTNGLQHIYCKVDGNSGEVEYLESFATS
jgi:type I site-specific restriction endonuclease